MKAIYPTAITTADLVASNLAETDHPAWSAGTTYADGERVIRPATHRIYESLGGANTGNVPESSPSNWVDVGPMNRWAMFDQAVGTISTGTGEIDVTLAPGAISALATVDTDAETVQVLIAVDGTTLYDQTKSTNAGGGMIADWYAYFTADVGKVASLTFMDLPLYAQAEVRVIVTGADPGGPVSIGTLLMGSVIDLGTTEAGAGVGISDFSRKQSDDFGVTDVVERAWAKRMTTRSMIATSAVDSIQRKLAGLRARPALWIGEEGFDSLTIYGFFKDFSIDLALPNISYCSLTIEGLI